MFRQIQAIPLLTAHLLTKATDSKSDSSSKAASNASNTNPSTGVAGGAFALALLSGAAVVMAKKKK